ncbi:MAG: hypothetical protein KME26_08120 [Oscillatoria princeps RMCB-10]|nr:hypothetical protein [Oscillatoria princeps RMCB-10]
MALKTRLFKEIGFLEPVFSASLAYQPLGIAEKQISDFKKKIESKI